MKRIDHQSQSVALCTDIWSWIAPLNRPAVGLVYGVERRIRIVVHGEKKPTESDDHVCPITFYWSLAKGFELKGRKRAKACKKIKKGDD